MGYTNAGKSTLLNALTGSHVLVENRLFATLDTASRRLRFPTDKEAIITDTVGFIRNLPEELMGAFRATLEELHDADLLLHVADIGSPTLEHQIAVVERILADLEMDKVPRLLVLNKADQVDKAQSAVLGTRFRATSISALHPGTLIPLVNDIERRLSSLTRDGNPC